MRAHGSLAGSVVVVCLVALLAERLEGHITFFSPKEMMLMKVNMVCLTRVSLQECKFCNLLKFHQLCSPETNCRN